MSAHRVEASSELMAMLFIDVEGSARLAAALGEQWRDVLEACQEIVEPAVRHSGGRVESVVGDGFFVTFTDLVAAGRAAVWIQHEFRSHRWPTGVGEVGVRMGLHVGHVERLGYGLAGLEVHRAQRVAAAAHGGQLLLSGVAAELLRDVVESQAIGAHRLKDFPAPIALFCAVIDGQGASAFPPPRTLALREGNLPAAPAGMVARDRDLERVRTALARDGERLVTLLGRGGVGETTLALTAANDLIEEYEGGVWWVDASQEREAEALRALIARSCRIDGKDAREESLIADLASRGRMLLVLDNLEGVARAAALLDVLLGRLPGVAILATSQLPLRCRTECSLQLDALAEPDALALLAQSAERLGVRVEDEPAAREFVALLDGLPLAIELAAVRLRLFTVADLVARLKQSVASLRT
jgi:class 3 adenylate cyclase